MRIGSREIADTHPGCRPRHPPGMAGQRSAARGQPSSLAGAALIRPRPAPRFGRAAFIGHPRRRPGRPAAARPAGLATPVRPGRRASEASTGAGTSRAGSGPDPAGRERAACAFSRPTAAGVPKVVAGAARPASRGRGRPSAPPPGTAPAGTPATGTALAGTKPAGAVPAGTGPAGTGPAGTGPAGTVLAGGRARGAAGRAAARLPARGPLGLGPAGELGCAFILTTDCRIERKSDTP